DRGPCPSRLPGAGPAVRLDRQPGRRQSSGWPLLALRPVLSDNAGGGSADQCPRLLPDLLRCRADRPPARWAAPAGGTECGGFATRNAGRIAVPSRADAGARALTAWDTGNRFVAAAQTPRPRRRSQRETAAGIDRPAMTGTGCYDSGARIK